MDLPRLAGADADGTISAAAGSQERESSQGWGASYRRVEYGRVE